MDAKSLLVGIACDKSFNPRARDGRECYFLQASSAQPSFNPRARDGREHQDHRR